MRLAVLLVSPLILLSCSEYDLAGPEEPTESLEDDEYSADDDTAPSDDDTASLQEVCDGFDNDGDGQVDEGYMDADHDGLADCIDDDCDVAFPPEEEVTIIEECDGSEGMVVHDPWNVVVEWTWESAGWGPIVMPAVGNLTDDNGDGVVDEMDVPDIAFTVRDSNQLVALHGDGSGVIFEVSGYFGEAGVTVADVDGDGQSEIIAATYDAIVGSNEHRVAAVDAAGSCEWESPLFDMGVYPQPTVADLDGDGDVEVVMASALVEGSSGVLIAELATERLFRTPVIADIDADGTSEIILGGSVFDHNGSVEWSTPIVGSLFFSAVVDIDGDCGGEVIFIADCFLSIHDDDGSLLNTFNIPGGGPAPGPPAVADFDGDGDIEIAFAGNQTLNVWEIDGTTVWSVPIQDISGSAGCSGYDVDGDGAYEVLFADENEFRIYDGATGMVNFSDDTHGSWTLWEYPVVSDVDNDGSAEIVVASNLNPDGVGFTGIVVYGHASNDWTKSGPTWGTHDFAVTNLNPDGSVPNPAPLSWNVHNLFRARPPIDDVGQADLIPVFGDYCVASCTDGPVRISYNVANQGALQAYAPVPVSLLTVDQGIETLIDTQYHWPIPPGRSVRGNIFELHPDQWGSGFIIRVDDDGFGNGAVDECDETNNEYAYYETLCY